MFFNRGLRSLYHTLKQSVILLTPGGCNLCKFKFKRLKKRERISHSLSSRGALPFVPHDIVLIHGKQYFIGTILKVEPEQALVRINPEYEDQLAGSSDWNWPSLQPFLFKVQTALSRSSAISPLSL